MSIDFSLVVVKETSVFDTNMTHNVSKMWREAGCYDAIYMSEGMLAKELIPFLKRGYEDMKNNPVRYKTLDADNGWGTYDQALPWLESVLLACKENPEAKVQVWK
jgi:hypothetical protein